MTITNQEKIEQIQELEANIASKHREILPVVKEIEQLSTKLQMVRENSRKVVTDVKGNKLPCELYVDGYMYENLKIMHDLVERDWDNIGFYCGYEGDGKTVMAFLNALVLDSSFNLNKVVFTPEQFSVAVDDAPKGSVIVWDEADDLAAGWNNSIVLAVKQKLKRIRSHNLHIELVTPSLFDVNKYFVISRTRYLIHIYSHGVERGFFRFFNMEGKKDLYINGRREWNWNAAKPAFKGRFTKLPDGFPIDWKEYQAKKDEATAGILRSKTGTDWQTKIKRYRDGCVIRARIFGLEHGLKMRSHHLQGIFLCGADVIKDAMKVGREYEGDLTTYGQLAYSGLQIRGFKGTGGGISWDLYRDRGHELLKEDNSEE